MFRIEADLIYSFTRKRRDDVGGVLRMLPCPSAVVGTSMWDSLISMAVGYMGVESFARDFHGI